MSNHDPNASRFIPPSPEVCSALAATEFPSSLSQLPHIKRVLLVCVRKPASGEQHAPLLLGVEFIDENEGDIPALTKHISDLFEKLCPSLPFDGVLSLTGLSRIFGGSDPTLAEFYSSAVCLSTGEPK